MAFTPPAFALLRVNTLNLDTALSTLLGRYKIVDNQAGSATSSNSNSTPVQNSLEILLARTNQVVVCETDRISSRDVFKQLSNELRDVLKEKDEVKNQKATLFLLGALLHRYFRIIKSYEGYSSWFTTPFNSDLFIAIRGALRLPADATYKNYWNKDLMILDVTTIVTALEVFRDNMYLKDQEQVPRYMKYPHLKDDVNFEIHLKEIIDEHSERGKITLNQFKAVRFIQSLGKKLEIEQQQVDDALIKWSKELVRDHSDFSQLNLESIESHVRSHIKDCPLQEKILDLLYTPAIKLNLQNMDHTNFLSEMKRCNANICSYILFGGYSLLLQSGAVKEKLELRIHQALGIEKDPSVVTSKDKLDGINFLQLFLTNNPEVVLDYEFFEGREKMLTLISQNELALLKKIKEEPVPGEEKTASSIALV